MAFSKRLANAPQKAPHVAKVDKLFIYIGWSWIQKVLYRYHHFNLTGVDAVCVTQWNNKLKLNVLQLCLTLSKSVFVKPVAPELDELRLIEEMKQRLPEVLTHSPGLQLHLYVIFVCAKIYKRLDIT